MRPAPAFLDAATPVDVAELLALERACFSHPWNARHFLDSMADPPRSRVAAVRQMSGEGRPAIVAYCVSLVVAGELHIYNVAVHPAHRGLGLGRWLMEFLLDRGRRQGATAALLEVRRGNETARRLYESLGFRVLSTRRDYYEDPVEDALTMECTLP